MALARDTVCKKSRDEINLDFHNSCLDHARKYRYEELTQKEKEFKRQYSWCLSADGKPKRSKSFTGRDPHKIVSDTGMLTSKQVRQQLHGHKSTLNRRCSVSRTLSSSSSTSSSTSTNTTEPPSRERSSHLSSSPNSGSELSSPGSGDAGSLESQFSSMSPISRRMSGDEGELPSINKFRRQSLLNTPSDERVNYLEKLWDNVFRFDKDDTRGSGGKQKSAALKESYRDIVMKQFHNRPGSEVSSPQLPSIANQTSTHAQRCSSAKKIMSPRPEICESKPTAAESPHDESKADQEQKEGKISLSSETESCNDLNEAPDQHTITESGKEDETTEIVQKDTETDSDVKTTPKKPAKFEGRKLLRRSSLNLPLNKPPFMTYTSRDRSLSVDHDISRNLWRTGLFSLLASRRRSRNRLVHCVNLAMSKDKNVNLNAKRWRDDLKRCRYLRIPKDSPYLSPISSDTEYDSDS